MEISKSTPYVRYRENISSTLHKGTIHIESEYLDRERKTTIESIEGQTWQNMVNGENKEEDILPRLGLKIEGNEDVLDTVEQHMSIDTIIGDVQPVANEDGTYTYEISTMEGSYAKTLDGENNFLLTSDGLVGDMYIKYNAQGEEVNGSIVMDNWQSSYTIENSNNGVIKSAILTGQTLVNKFDDKCYDLSNWTNWDGSVYKTFSFDNLEVGKEYVFYAPFKGTNKGRDTAVILNAGNRTLYNAASDTHNTIETSFTLNDGEKLNFSNYMIWGDSLKQDYPEILIVERKDYYKNMPFFKGMQSVQMPVLTTSNYKNLANDIFIDYGYISDGIINIQKKWLISDFISIEPNVSYTTRSQGATNDGVFAIAFYDEDKKFISKKMSNNEISPTNAKFARINVRKSNGLDITEEEKNDTILYLEKTAEVLPFESYKSNILTVNEDVELRGIGDVKDELNLMTGELAQRIGEIVLDGTNTPNIMFLESNRAEGYTVFPMQISDVFPNITANYNNYTQLISNNFNYLANGYSNCLGGKWMCINTSYLVLSISNNELESFDIQGLNKWLSLNKTTIYYPSEKSIKTIDLTIKDQDDKIIQSLHTHPSTTHINLSSDGLIPDAELSYTMYGNIGETTGEQITDGTDSKLIEGKIYGDTLLNVLPSPSLKNSMDYNTSMQKLNNGYDNINVVDGEFKKATLYGQTMINLAPKTEDTIISNYQSGDIVLTPQFRPLTNLKANTRYTVIFKASNVTNATEGMLQYQGADNNDSFIKENIGNYTLVNGCNKVTFTTLVEVSKIQLISYSTLSTGGGCTIHGDSIMILEGDYTNQDIPYFEGMQSVVMPSLMTYGKNLIPQDYQQGRWNQFNKTLIESSTSITSKDYIDVSSIRDTVTTSISQGYSYALCFYGKNKEHIYINDTWGNGFTSKQTFNFKTVAGNKGEVYYVRINIRKVDNTNINPTEINNIAFQLEIGTQATTYKPHQSNTLTTPEDVTLRAVGDVRDELDCLTGELTQIFGEVGITGDENFENFMTGGSCIKCTFTTPKITSDNSGLLCDKLPINNTLWGDSNTEGIRYYDSKIHIAIDKTKLESYDTTGISNYIKSIGGINLIYKEPTPIIKTVNLSITNQDNQPQTALHSIANGYISTSSQGSLPKVTYEVPTSNSYYLDMVKPNTQYTSKSSSDCNATIDGTSYPLSANGTFTTPSTITNNFMVLDTPVDDLMFIEGDLTSRKLLYFEGLTSVENPLVVVGGKNLLDVDTISLDSSKWSSFSDAYANMNTPFMRLKPNTIYQMYGTITQKPNTYNLFKFHDKNGKEINRTYTPIDNNNNNNSRDFTVDTRFTTPEDGVVYLTTYPAYDDLNNIKWLKEMLRQSTLMIEEGTIKTDYEKPTYAHLSTTPQITLHRIGDIKDELDLVNECVVRKTKCMTFDGSDDENWKLGQSSVNSYGMVYFNYEFIDNNIVGSSIPVLCDKFRYTDGTVHSREKECIGITANSIRLVIKANRLSSVDITAFRQWLSKNPITVIYELETPTTEPVRIVPQNPKQSTVSLTLQSPLQKVGNVADQLRWNPYKGHYVRYNYIQDGVANSTYTFEDLKDMNERKFVNLYNQRTYIDTDHTVQVISHGLSRYCLAEQGKQYQVRWDWVEQPSVDTIKVDLCGNVKEIPSSDNSVVIDVEKFAHQFIQIQGLGLTGKITNLMVIETVNGEIPDVDFFSGIQCVGNTVTIDGNTKVQIDMEQTNGNLIDIIPKIYNNGNNLQFNNISVKHNRQYHISNEPDSRGMDNFGVHFLKEVNGSTQSNITIYGSGVFDVPFGCKYITIYRQTSEKGNANIYHKIDLHYADMAKDGIRPRYCDKESIILPMKLCRVGNIYDNLYYDDLKGYYRIQQSIGHKYFTGETTEVWTMETTDGYRTIKFTCTSANIDQIALGETICNSFKHLSTINDDIEGFIIYNGNFVLRVDKDRLTDKTVDGFKTLLASSPIHLFYQLKTPQMINLTEYPNRIEFNTYRDEIFTFFKGMNPTKFTLSVPMDKTYRYEIEEEGQGLANRVTVNNETISAENVVAVKEVRGQGIANIIEDVDNVVITPRPNHGAVATSHTLNNTKPATIRVHGFEASGETAVANYNVTDKAYQLKVMSSNGDNSLSDYYVLNVPYKLETYADGTKDMVYYDEAYKQWHFKGSSVKEYTVASNGTLSETIEIFRGLAPRSGMIAEFKLMFTSGTTAARMYYSLDGITYNYTSLKRMTDGNYLYVGIFNTGGTKIDIAYKTDTNEEYTNLSPLSTQVPECFMVNQITNCTFCEVTLDKQYIYSEMNSPIELDTYDGTTKVFMDGNATDTNIIIRNDATTKIVNTYTDTTYTVYWKYVDGLGNLRITLGGTTVEVDGKQEYATIKTQLNAPQELLYVGGYNLSIKDLMVVKGVKIDDLPYFEGSRQVGTLVLDEEGNKSYKITLVQGGSVLEQRDEDAIAFKDDNKHNVVVHKIVGICPTKVD